MVPRSTRPARRRVDAGADYTAKGNLVLATRPDWHDTTLVALHRLVHNDTGEDVSPDQVTDPALLAVFLNEFEGVFDADTDAEVDADTVDWDTATNPSTEPADGLRHANTVTTRPVWVPDWYCTDPHAAGLRDRYHPAKDAETATADSDPTTTARTQADIEEHERAQRRQVLTLNKLGAAAQTVRRTGCASKSSPGRHHRKNQPPSWRSRWAPIRFY